MNKYELACQVAKASGKTLKEVIPIINSLFKVMGETILAGVKINIGDLGSFSLKVRKQRKGYDPYHRVPMIIPESMSLIRSGSLVAEKNSDKMFAEYYFRKMTAGEHTPNSV